MNFVYAFGLLAVAWIITIPGARGAFEFSALLDGVMVCVVVGCMVAALVLVI